MKLFCGDVDPDEDEPRERNDGLFIVVLAAVVQPATVANLSNLPSDNIKLPIARGHRDYVDIQSMIGTVDGLVANFRTQLEAAVAEYNDKMGE